MQPDSLIHNGVTTIIGKASDGIDQMIMYNNIAITTLTVGCLVLIAGNILQYWVGNRRQEKDFDRFVSVTKAMAGIEGAIDELKSVFVFVQQLYKQGVKNADPDQKS